MAKSVIDRTGEHVRRGARWAAWAWIAAGLATAAFGIFAPPVAHGVAGLVVSIGFPAVGVAALVYASRQRVVGRVSARLEYPVTWTFVGLVLVEVVFRMAARPTQVTPWVAVLGALPAVPCLYGAWRVGRE